MSFEITKWALNQTGLTSYEKLVLAVHADLTNHVTELCCPSAETVAEIAGCDERVVRNCRKSLQEKGRISLTSRPGKSPLIEFHWRTPEPDTGLPRNENPDPDQDTPEPDTGHPGTRYRTPRNENPGTPERGPDYQRKELIKGEGWQPSASALDALRAQFENPKFEIPESWVPMFVVWAESKSIKPDDWNYRFVNWARVQLDKDRKFQQDEPKPPVAKRNFESPAHVSSPRADLVHAERMVTMFEEKGDNDQLRFWKAEVAKLKLKMGGDAQ